MTFASAAAQAIGSGDDRVDAALAGLSGLAGTPVTEHVRVLEEVHRGLQDVLASIDAEPTAERPLEAEATAERPFDAGPTAERPPYPGPRS